jgi:hypothetical protein
MASKGAENGTAKSLADGAVYKEVRSVKFDFSSGNYKGIVAGWRAGIEKNSQTFSAVFERARMVAGVQPAENLNQPAYSDPAITARADLESEDEDENEDRALEPQKDPTQNTSNGGGDGGDDNNSGGNGNNAGDGNSGEDGHGDIDEDHINEVNIDEGDRTDANSDKANLNSDEASSNGKDEDYDDDDGNAGNNGGEFSSDNDDEEKVNNIYIDDDDDDEYTGCAADASDFTELGSDTSEIDTV